MRRTAMQEGPESREAEENIRPQRGGEAATTRFGMEDGDNTDVPATGLDPERQSDPPPKGGRPGA